MKIRLGFPSLLVTIALIAVACGGTSGNQPATGEPIIFGTAIALTGSLNKEGLLAKQGYDLWFDWIKERGGITVNGVKHPVQLIYEDDQSKSAQTAILVQKLITEKHANFILGPYGSAATSTAAAEIEVNKIPMVEGNGAAQSIFSRGYKYTFAVLSPANLYLQGVLDMAATLSPKATRVAILYADDPFSVEVFEGVKAYAPQKGMQVVFSAKYTSGSTDVTGVVTAAKAQNPDILLNSGHFAEAVAIHRAAKDLKVNAKIFAYSVGPSTPDFIQSLSKAADYVYDGSQWTPEVKYTPDFYLSVSDYVAAYKRKFSTNDPPDYHVAESTAACLALQRAIENAGSLDPQKVRDALARLDVMTFFGRIKFDDRGVNIYKPMVVEQIQNGVHYTVFPKDVANGTPQYPTPPWDQR